MISALVLAASVPAQPVGIEDQRFADCVAQTENDPEAAIHVAESWRLSGGGLNARLCQGLAYAAQKRWPAARLAFELAAQDAQKLHDPRASSFWMQAGNAALAGGEDQLARNDLDAALATGALTGADKGEALLDRARASVALGQQPAARTDLDQALALVPADPLGWLLSATLARRMGDLARAEKDITQAATLSPDDASVALEAGNIAALRGAPDAAKMAWEAAVRNGPDTQAGRSAKAALSQFQPPSPPQSSSPIPQKTAGPEPVAVPH